MLRRGRSFSGRERNCCFLNTLGTPAAEGQWANVSASSGLDYPDDGRACVLVDWDRDGDLDAWISNRNAPRLRYLRNNCPADARFLSLRLRGNGVGTNRDAIGARVEVTARHADGSEIRPQIKTVRAGEGFLAQSSKWLHFGLGDATEISKVIVDWCDARTNDQPEEFTALDVNGRFELVQDTGRAHKVEVDRRMKIMKASVPQVPPQSDRARVPLVIRLPLPLTTYRTLGGTETRLRSGRQGESLLINLWSTSCRPCLAELTELARRAADLRADGIDVVALVADDLSSDDSAAAERARSVLSKIGFPFRSGMATPENIAVLQWFHDFVIPLHRPLPLPTSLLVDDQGRVSVIYKGRVSVDDLLTDAASSWAGGVDQLQLSPAVAGRVLRHDLVRQSRTNAEVNLRLDYAERLSQMGVIDGAHQQFTEVLKLQPESAYAFVNRGTLFAQQGQLSRAKADYEQALRTTNDLGHAHAHYNLARILSLEGDMDQAELHYQRTLRIKPDYFQAHVNLGLLILDRGDIAKAKKHLRRALQIESQNADVHNSMGVVLRTSADLEGARRHFEKALQIDPRHTHAQANLERVRRLLRNAPADAD